MKKKRKKKQKRIFVSIILLIIMSIMIFLVFNKDTSNKTNDDILKELNYSSNAITLFKQENIVEDIIDYGKYSKTLETAITLNKYISKNLDYYFEITYINNDNFITNINSLIEKGYNATEINNITGKITDKNINIIINHEYNQNLNSYLNLSYFKESNIKRYLDYAKANNELSNENIVTYVNINLDYDFYTNIKSISNQSDPTILVDKYNALSSDYIPTDLEQLGPSYADWPLSLRHDAKIAFEKLCDAAKKENLTIKASSTYRSYSSQNSIYNNYVARDGKAEADTYSARPGHSEHQLGLAVDVKNQTSTYTEFENTKEYPWMIKNAHLYGFTQSYPKNKEHITGYMYESWHYRYVGVELATTLYNNNLTLGEYYGRL